MLVLSRKIGESISIGKDVAIRIVSIDKNNVRIGIDAPKSVVILREELKEAVANINIEAKTVDKDSIQALSGLRKKLQ